ncbi:MAG: anthranilate synthase component I family protein [Bacteroidia bacterium]|nr:anthranilate synthase component I family protein [Bacteroidia bacterium]
MEEILNRLGIPERVQALKDRGLYWAMNWPYIALYDTCGQDTDRYGRYEWLLGVAGWNAPVVRTFAGLPDAGQDWLMGLISYDAKQELEPGLRTSGEPLVAFDPVMCFVPEIVLAIPRGGSQIEVLKGPPALRSLPMPPKQKLLRLPPPVFRPLVSQAEYEEMIRQIQRHIVDGDCYELNLSQAFVANFRLDQPERIFWRLTRVSPAPFAALLRLGPRYLLSASPERLLQLQDGRLLSQPMKGTAPRGETAQQDQEVRERLRHSEKEQAENVMIVDLTRNDLNRSALPGSVSVSDLFEVQTFAHVHQMISTVTAQRDPQVPLREVIGHVFPPGSMTGAPKVRSMELIDRYEQVARGAYAGSIGYIDPQGNFDWNVVIRTLVYDDELRRLCYHVGGAITYDSVPSQEYEETLIKARALRKLFE